MDRTDDKFPYLWSPNRVPTKDGSSDAADPAGWRSPFQVDYDRLLFSAPVRRLADKTQVWPLEQNDGVRTRLTHSHEVANLARSIGSRIARSQPDIFGSDLHEVVQPILSAIGLAHDLGNPPFGHQGEAAISRWFTDRSSWIFTKVKEGGEDLPEPVPDQFHGEFTSFDGNPQTLRLLARLQTHIKHLGLDLTAATLAASLKYPVGANATVAGHPVLKKFGYFQSEKSVVDWMREEVGISEGQRHPLTWIMEACDDIAYSILDVDDVMKKKIISPDDVLSILKHNPDSKDSKAVKRAEAKFVEVHDLGRDPDVARDIKIGYLRAFLIDELIVEASNRFQACAPEIMGFTHGSPLMDSSKLCKALKKIARQHAFANSLVLKVEAVGAKALAGLMNFFWRAIDERKERDDLLSARTSAVAKYGWSLVSPNYIEEAVRCVREEGAGSRIRYWELRLLTDMMSGMTDTFAINLWERVKALDE